MCISIKVIITYLDLEISNIIDRLSSALKNKMARIIDIELSLYCEYDSKDI